MPDGTPNEIVVRQGRPWQWLCIVVLSGLCCGVVGLYTGSYITGRNMSKALDTQRLEFESGTRNEAVRHERELTGVNQNTALVAKSVESLGTTVAHLASEVDAVAHHVGVVSETVDAHAAVAAKTQTVATIALKKAALNAAKTDVFEAKLNEVETTLAHPTFKGTPVCVYPNVTPKNDHGFWNNGGHGH